MNENVLYSSVTIESSKDKFYCTSDEVKWKLSSYVFCDYHHCICLLRQRETLGLVIRTGSQQQVPWLEIDLPIMWRVRLHWSKHWLPTYLITPELLVKKNVVIIYLTFICGNCTFVHVFRKELERFVLPVGFFIPCVLETYVEYMDVHL